MAMTIDNPVELRRLGFEALVKELGWINAVRFLHQYEVGQGDYTSERDAVLPAWDVAAIIEKARGAE